MRRQFRGGSMALSSALVALAGCGGDDGGGIADECNPLGGTACLMPWPSSSYLEADETTETGYRLALPIEAMPVNVDGIAIDPTAWNRRDGFSPSGAILAAFPAGVVADGLPGHDDPAASLADDSLTVVVNVETGERLLHFAEVNVNNDDPSRRALMIRPLERMAPASRYAVGLRLGIGGGDGEPLARPEAFAALVAGEDFDHPRYAALAAGADDLFAALDGAGLPREEALLAWDFVTASDQDLTADMMAMREQALPAIGEAAANLTFTAEEVAPGSDLSYRLLLGTYQAPNFLSDAESDTSILLRDDEGRPRLDGTYDANFSVVIPACVADAPLPVPAVVFGHGIFGNSESNVDDDLILRIANDHCVVLVAGDWIGLTDRQLTSVALAVNDLNRSHAIVEKLGQAVINFIALEQLVRGPMAASPQFAREGTPIIDLDRVVYFGASLGGIMGATLMFYDPTLERGVLGVPGGVWSLMIERSFAWGPLQVAATGAYEDPYDYQMLISLLASSMERHDPITTARRVLADPLPGTTPKRLFLYEAVDDCLVTNLATEMVARTMGLEITGPSVKTPYGLEPQEAPMSSALAILDERRAPGAPPVNVPPAEDNGTHAGVNERNALLRQVFDFLDEGDIVSPCRTEAGPAPCDCAEGVCD